MLISEVCKKCSITKKAIEYYLEQGLLKVTIMENGYRNFSDDDVERIKKIAILRRLGLSISQILDVLEDKNMSKLKMIEEKRKLEINNLKAKQLLLQQLIKDKDWESIQFQIEQLDQRTSILNRMIDKFPGYYGKYIVYHFARFLNEPIKNQKQLEAFNIITHYLDGLEIVIDDDLKDYLDDITITMNEDMIKLSSDNLYDAIENFDQYLIDNKDIIEQYLAFKQSDLYKESKAYRLQMLFEELNRQNGYNDIFIPAMKQLSDSYREYYDKLQLANRKFIKIYPQ